MRIWRNRMMMRESLLALIGALLRKLLSILLKDFPPFFMVGFFITYIIWHFLFLIYNILPPQLVYVIINKGCLYEKGYLSVSHFIWKGNLFLVSVWRATFFYFLYEGQNTHIKSCNRGAWGWHSPFFVKIFFDKHLAFLGAALFLYMIFLTRLDIFRKWYIICIVFSLQEFNTYYTCFFKNVNDLVWILPCNCIAKI